MEPLESQVSFLLEADRLKTVLRQSTLTDRSRQENSAEHSWHLALMALVLAEPAPPRTHPRPGMATLGSHHPGGHAAGPELARQAAAERAAADRIFSILPLPEGPTLRALWDEFEERKTPEAKFARALDRLQPMLINMVTGGGTWRAHAVTADQVLTRVALIEDGSPSLGRYARDMIARAVELGILAPAAGAAPR